MPRSAAPAPEPSPRAERFVFLDGLRGLASLAVVFFHLNIAVSLARADWAPHALLSLFVWSRYGVSVFFALSGFVIAYSVRAARIDARYAGRFALRRVLRLDPPYLVSIALAVGLAVLSTRLFPDLHREMPTWRQLAAHVVYMQDLLRLGNIVDIYWTLCLEVQFYLVLVVSLGVVQAVARRSGAQRWGTSALFNVLCLGSLALSVLQYFDVINLSPPGLFLPYWFYFLPGALVWWSLAGEVPLRWFYMTLLMWAAGMVFRLQGGKFDVSSLMAMATATLILVCGRRRALGRWLGARPLQYLGSVSYSLYLMHTIVGWPAVTLTRRLLGGDLSRAQCWLAFTVGVAASLVGTHLFHVVIERPALAFSRRISLRPGH